MLKQYPNQIKVVFKHFPLRNHRFALPAALASMAAHEQGKFWPYHDAIFANISKLNDDFFIATAEKLKLDLERFKSSFSDKKFMAKVRGDVQLGREIGVRGTPTLFINGRLVKRKSLEECKKLIDGLLEDQRSGKDD